MPGYRDDLKTIAVLAATISITALIAACAPQQPVVQQVQATNPSVTYKYRTDQDLLQADQTATTYCSQYQAVPRTARFTTDTDGGKAVVFECVKSVASTPAPVVNPNLTYTYRTDQELLDATRNAQVYCLNNGSSQMVSNIVTNANGSRTVAFQCAVR